jgi:hypothetical protein
MGAVTGEPAMSPKPSRRLVLLAAVGTPLAACAQPRAQVNETRLPPRVVDPKTELERRGR